MSKGKRTITWLQRFLLLGFAFLFIGVILTGVEFLSRLLCPQWAPVAAPRYSYWNYDATLGWSHKPNRKGRFDRQDFSIQVDINSDKLRDDEYPRRRTGKKRMLVLGDSFGWGGGVDLEDRFSEILERRYSDWEIINASVAGYSTDQEYLYLRERGFEYAPDVVLLLVYENDFEGNTGTDYNLYNKPCFVRVGNELVLKNSPVPPLKQIYWGWVALKSRIPRLTKDSAADTPEESGQSPDEIMALLIRDMNAFCTGRNMRLVLVSVPMDTGKRAVLQKACSSESIPYLPLDSAFAAAKEQMMFQHDLHWNAAGQRLAADAIDAFLRQQGIFPPMSSAPATP
jgi:hypothetical protein